MNDLTKRYHTTRWEKLAKAVMRRDGYQCQLSKRYGRMIPAELVHHVFPADEYPELFWTPWNLVALSRAAHNRVHDRQTGALTAEGLALQERVRKKLKQANMIEGERL